MVNPRDSKDTAVSSRDIIKSPRARRTRCTCPYCKEGKNRVSNGKKQHICHIPGCNKIYGKTSHLRDHLHWHSGERPFVCSWLYCGKRFHRSDKLHRHSRTHTGEKSYECPECGKGFMRSDHLNKHIRVHAKNGRGTRRSKRVVTSTQPVYSNDEDDDEETLENMVMQQGSNDNDEEMALRPVKVEQDEIDDQNDDNADQSSYDS